ncbi:Tn3 family transposase [Alcaligenes faecalis]|uniref:Tn3 family transposase n=1 Tax=Alcaligenes faecalis TaxID=511 RepID=UPI003B75C8B0
MPCSSTALVKSVTAVSSSSAAGASSLNLMTAAIVLWNTVYLERAAHALRGNGHAVDDSLLQYLSPLGWEHINLTGDYLWRSSAKIGAGKFRPLRPLQPA